MSLIALLSDAHSQAKPIPLDAFRVRSSPDARSPQATRDVVAQFGVDTAPRYAPRDGVTWCNIFVWDWSRAMGAELPHWVNAQGLACAPGDDGARETRANELLRRMEAGAWGWHGVNPDMAVERAWRGCPTVVGWRAPDDDRPGHIAVLLPTPMHDLVLRIAQAGRTCAADMTLAKGFGTKPVRFYVHQ